MACGFFLGVVLEVRRLCVRGLKAKTKKFPHEISTEMYVVTCGAYRMKLKERNTIYAPY